MVIGHKNPDSDSICSAIAYAGLMNAVREKNIREGMKDCGREYEACRAGVINKETEFVLRRFGFQIPRLCLDVRAQVSDLDIRDELGIPSSTSLRNAWRMMIEHDITTLPVIHHDGQLEGIITVQDIAMANMDSLEADVLSKAKVPLRNLLETIDGELICEMCGKPIAAFGQFTAEQVAQLGVERYGKRVCVDCGAKLKAAQTVTDGASAE